MKYFGAHRLACAAVAASTRRRLVGTLSFLSSVFCLLSSVLSGCAATNSTLVIDGGTATPSICPRAWIGEQSLDPRDTAATHTLQRTLKPVYVRLSIDWSDAATNWAGTDAKFAANAGISNIIVLFYGTNALAESNALVHCIARYQAGTGGSGFTNRIWGVDAYNEPNALPSFTNANSATQADSYNPYVLACRWVINQAGYKGVIRLLGPSLSYDYIDGYASVMYADGTWSNLDVIAAHDYFACPGNGVAGIVTGAYVHVTDSPGVGYPNLAGRIQNMQTWAATNGASSTVFLEEYGLFSGDAGDARLTAQIVSSNKAVMILSNPNGPVGQDAWNNALGGGVTQAYWDAVMYALMNTACTVP